MTRAFLFPGQGSQSPGMGAELFDAFPDHVAAADRVLGCSLRDLCAGGDGRLHRTEYAQTALFTVSALTYLRRRREQPAAAAAAAPSHFAGHSLGELTALFAAGCFDFETGLRIVRRRGELMARQTGGGMAAVLGVELDRLLALLERGGLDTVDVANHNVPGQIVISGPRGSAHAVAALLAEEGVGKCVPLNVSIAAHSRYMADAAREFGAFLRDLHFAEPAVPVIANVTARPYRADAAAELLTRHLVEPVRWWDTLCLLAAEGVDEIEEIGPGDVLTKMWRRARPDLPPAVPPAALARPLLTAEQTSARALSNLGAEGEMTTTDRATSTYAFVLSAADKQRLDRYAARFADHFADASGAAVPLADIAFTLQTGRSAMAHRLAVVAADVAEVTQALRAYSSGQPHPSLAYSAVSTPLGSATTEPTTQAEAAAVWLEGYVVDWARLWPQGANKVSLPAYPWGSADPAAPTPAPTLTPTPTPTAPTPASADTRQQAENYLLDVYAEVSGIPAARLDAHVPMANYGLSSFIIARLNARLERDLGERDRTLFFAHENLAGVAAELSTRHAAHWASTTAPSAALSSLTDPRPAAPTPATPDAPSDGAIAIIGLAGRYPQAPDLDRFWEVLAGGRDCVGQIPAHRARADWPVDLMWGGFLDDVESFDPLLFNISPRDAELMDPQERLFLEVVWEALEDAGYTRARLATRHRSRVAVYAGAMHNEYPYFGVEQTLRGAPAQDAGATLGGIANRVSFLLDLHGPSMSVDTMCSSSLTAIHLAVRALRSGESEVAIAGAVNLSLHPNKFVQQYRMKLNSTTHRCRSFGAGGDGFVPAEGAGVVLLKPLARALADGDRIHAVIRGTSVVHAGRTNGYLVPSPEAQGEMVARALDDAGIDPASIGLLELHGAGTALGDPVEIKGLMRVFGGRGLAPASIPIGSVKSTIGHVESAAGIAGLTKAVLQMRHGTLAPSLHAEELNPNIAWDEVPFRVQRERAAWPSGPGPRRAGISSFGAGGTIAHVVVEEAPPQAADQATSLAVASGRPQLVVLSGYDEDRLRQVAARLVTRLRDAAKPVLALPDLAYTLQVGREALRERLAVVVRDTDELCGILDRFVSGAYGGTGEVVRGRAPGSGYAVGELADTSDLRTVAEHWVGGGAVDWDRLHADSPARPRTVALPSYPFAKVRCWLPEPDAAGTGTAVTGTATAALSPAVHAATLVPAAAPAAPAPAFTPIPAPAPTSAPEIPLYQRGWAPGEPLSRAEVPAGRLVCVFSEHSEAVARALVRRAGSDRVLLVREGGDVHDGVPGYTTGAEAAAMADALLETDPDLSGWLDLADLYRPEAERGLWAARLAMLQRFVGARAVVGLRVLQVTYGLQTYQHSAPSASGARVAAFVRVVGAEYQRLDSRVLDIDVPPSLPELALEGILAEWATPDADPGRRFGEVCHRQGQRYLPALRPIEAAHRPWRADADAAYLVAGGTRGLGALVARFLAERGARRIALIGTAPAGEDHETVRTLRALGADVLCHAGSLADRPALAAFLDRVRAVFGRIDGIVNCAGRSGQGVGFAYLDLDRARGTLEPKTDGFEALSELTEPDRPSFSVQFSSVCAAVPAVAAGVADYAAANGFLDLATEQRIWCGETWLRAVNWPQWTESGGGRGKPNPCAGVGLAGLTDESGLRLLERVIALPAGAVLLPVPPLHDHVDIDGLLALPRAANPGSASAAATSAPAPTSTLTPTPTPTPTSQRSPAGATSSAPIPPAWLVEIFASALRIPAADFDATARFGDLGVESIMLAELLMAIEQRLDRSLEPSLLLEYPTLESLTAKLDVGERAPEPEPEPESPAFKPSVPTPAPPPSFTPAPAPPPASAPTSAPTLTSAPATNHLSGRIAVVGMACRFPGAPDTDAFWAGLLAGRCAVDEIPLSRWDHRVHYRPTPQAGYSISKWGGFVDDIEFFDPDYFHLGDDEAACLDPAIRMVLEGAATCLRDAGYQDSDMAGRDVGVFVGARLSEYGRRVGSRPGVLRSDQNFIAAHVAHRFDLRGPNLVVDSACSSSLVAVQLACRSLLAGESTAALAAGVEVLLDEQSYLDLSAARALSPSGRCMTFDQRADGFVPGEGCGVVLLKTLEAALADGDRIHAVIEAVAVNNDGHTMGITTPNPAAQSDLVRKAMALAGRVPAEIGMVEAHGTGTLIGDPIELRALTDVYGADANGATGWCAIGSVKSNLGHLLSAAGIAGLAKAVLSLEHGWIPATLFCDTPNPRFDFAHSPFFPNTTGRAWTRPPGQRVAAISSFGLGGTNAHLIASGFDPALRAGHPPARPALPPPTFSRRRLWLDPVPDRTGPDSPTAESSNAASTGPASSTSASPAPEPPASAPPAPAAEPLVASILDLQLSGDFR